MTEFYDYSKSPLSPYQQAREQALKTSAAVLSSSQALWSVKKPPTAIEGVDDLLKTADWILGDDQPDARPIAAGVLEVPRDQVPSLFEWLGRNSEDCGHPECPIHAPTREAKDLNPEDAKSSFDPPVGVDPGKATGWTPPGVEGDMFDDGPAQAKHNPFVDPHEVWKKQHGEPAPAVIRDLPDANTRPVGLRFVTGEHVYQVTRNEGDDGNHWLDVTEQAASSSTEDNDVSDDEEMPEF